MRQRVMAVATVLALGGLPGVALALGGDDVNTGTKINQATQLCQAEIAKRGANYAGKAAKAINDCLDAIVKCDEQSSAANALTCRRKLLVPGAGKCAVGKLDEGASMLGSGAALHAQTLSGSNAALLKEMRLYSSMLQRKCFDAAGVDLGSVSIGLGFSPTPANNLALADAANQHPGGIGCLASGLVLQTHPLADAIVSVLNPLHDTCVASSVALELGTACTTNADCGASGVCGKLAQVVRGGSIEECQGPPPVCGDSEIGFPETCDDGNVASGDGCSATCLAEFVCGDGFSIEPEACDDGNLVNGDGCSNLCVVETPPSLLFPATGQTTCWDVGGFVIACPGTGQDGDIQAGATLAYTDLGDGTIMDNNTGLMWEKLSDDGSIHDWDNTYAWDIAVLVKIATLNGGGGFAGHTDWRMPNKKELEGILNSEFALPAVSPVFHSACILGATVLTGSCTMSADYWSSTTYLGLPSDAWVVRFNDGAVGPNGKIDDGIHVRAVRGGP